MTCESALTIAAKLNIATESEHRVPDQVCELAASSIVEGVNMKIVGMEVSPTHSPTTECDCLAISLENCFDFRG